MNPEENVDPPPATRLGGLRFDGTITAGNILTAAVLGLGLLMWGVRVESRQASSEDRIARIERQVERTAETYSTIDERLSRIEGTTSQIVNAIHGKTGQ